MGKTLRDLFGEDTPVAIKAVIANVMATGKPLLAHEMIGLHDRDNLLFDIVPVFDPAGASQGVVTLVVDITKRRSAERALRDSETFNRAVMENMIDAHIVIDRTGVIRTFNQAAVGLFGYQVDEVIGENVSLLMTAVDHDGHDGYLSSYLTTGTSAILGKGPREVAGRHKDGGELFLELNIGRFDSGGEVHFVGSLRDISERKHSEQALRQSQEEAVKSRRQLADAIDSIPEGFALYDSAHRMILHNKTLRQMYPALVEGFDRRATFEELIRIAARGGVILEMAGSEGDWIAERTASFGQSDEPIEQHLQDGRWVLISDQPTADGGIVSVRTDITELKQREDELRQAQKMEALGPGCVKTLAAMPIRDGLTV
jgi:PAS domain S-box-containing protein